MPRKRKVTSKETTPAQKSQDVYTPSVPLDLESRKRPSWLRYLPLLIILVVILALFAVKYKNLFIVATVNGDPISRLTLEQELNSKYADQTLDSLISEKIILSEAQKKGVTVSQKEIDNRIKEIEDRLKGQISLDDALKAQGFTRDSFQKQLEIQLTIDKMFDSEATVSEKEIDDYLAQNPDMVTSSTDPAKLRTDVKDSLKQQKIGDLFDAWFTQIKSKANVNKW